MLIPSDCDRTYEVSRIIKKIMAASKHDANKLFKSGKWSDAARAYSQILAGPAQESSGVGNMDANIFTNRR